MLLLSLHSCGSGGRELKGRYCEATMTREPLSARFRGTCRLSLKRTCADGGVDKRDHEREKKKRVLHI